MKIYPIRNHRKIYRDGQLIAHLFVFKSDKSKITYFLECEVFEKNILALKFYDKNHKDSKNRFSFLTKSDEVWSILHTCIQVIPILEGIYPECSFVAVGARGISPDGRQEQVENTQRYIAYKRILFKLFENSVNYTLIDSDEHSALLMMNILEFVENHNLKEEEFNEKVLTKYVEIVELMENEFLEIHNFQTDMTSNDVLEKIAKNRLLKIFKK